MNEMMTCKRRTRSVIVLGLPLVRVFFVMLDFGAKSSVGFLGIFCEHHLKSRVSPMRFQGLA